MDFFREKLELSVIISKCSNGLEAFKMANVVVSDPKILRVFGLPKKFIEGDGLISEMKSLIVIMDPMLKSMDAYHEFFINANRSDKVKDQILEDLIHTSKVLTKEIIKKGEDCQKLPDSLKRVRLTLYSKYANPVLLVGRKSYELQKMQKDLK